jgi:hypothetical protein
MERKIKIIHNRARCKRCGEIVESLSVHDFRPCECFRKTGGSQGVAVDGGLNYLRRVGNPTEYEELSESRLYTDEERDEYNRHQTEIAELYGLPVKLME